MVTDNESMPMLKINEVALILHAHPNTIRRWNNQGILRSYRINQRGDRRFKPQDIDRLLLELTENFGAPRKVDQITAKSHNEILIT